ncbi:hypothetical protein ACH5RR_035156 [Cinchona calisaya]|uniref:J domain-containing protein n=1 Tax=Cinchona calisaya TaxID=153742 RepID=A0ABD2YHG0_9GENT
MESLTRPFFHHRRKLSNASSSINNNNNNGLSFSGKDSYDDVFAGGGPKPKLGAGAPGFVSRKVAAGDYAEIFGGRNGTRGGCSIPVLDLSDHDERNGSADFRSSVNKLDYSTIFGGFGGDDVAATSMAVPPYEELFNGVKKSKTHKAKARMSAEIGSSFNSSENNESHSSEASDQIFDGGKQFNMSYHKTGQRRKDGSNGTTHVAQLHAVPGFTHVIDETACVQKTEQANAKLPVKAEVNHNRISSDHLQKIELDKANPPVKAEVNHNRSSSDHLQKTELDKTKPPVRVEVHHNRSSSDHLQRTQQDRAMPPVNYNRSSSDHLQRTEQDRAKPPVNYNRSSSYDISEGKSGKRAKWQLPTTQASESLVKDKGKCNQYASHSRDKLFDVDEHDKKSEPSEVPPTSSSSTNLNGINVHFKQSGSSNCGPKVEASEKVASGYSTPFSDEELDVNSAAAASAAALKKAIEQAQESIRIAKEIMERKRNPVQSSKSHSKEILKAMDRGEIKHVEEAKDFRENHLTEACESLNSEVQDFIGIDQNIGLRSGEVSNSFNNDEKPSTCTQADVAMNGENVEVAEENGVAMWFTQLLNNGKHRMAALASELKNSILQPSDKDVHDIQETKSTKVNLEWDSTPKVNPVDRILEFRNTEAKLNALGRPEEFEKYVDNSDLSMFAHEERVSETLIFAQENEITNNIQHVFDEGGKCEEKLEDRHVTISDRQFELKQSVNTFSEDESLNVEQKAFDQELENKLEDIHVWKENDHRVDEEENDKQQEEFHLWVGNEGELKMATGYASNGKTQEDDPQATYNTQETDEQRSTQSVDEEENHIMSEEEHVWEVVERRPAWTFQNEEADSRDEDTDSSLANQKVEVNSEYQEIGNTLAGTEGSAENPRENLFQEAVHEEQLNAAVVDAYNVGQSANLGDTEEACRSEVENISEETGEPDIIYHEENDNLVGFTERTIQQEGISNEEKANRVGVSKCLYEVEGDAKTQEADEEASRLKAKWIPETSSVNHGDAEENIMESITQDFSEAVASDDKPVDFDFAKVKHESELSKDTEKVASFIQNGTEEDATDSEDATEAPAVQKSSNFDFTDMNGQKQTHENDSKSEFSINIENCNGSENEVYGQNQIEESDRESESGINPENGDGLFHESAGSAEISKVDGIAAEKEIELEDIEMHHEEREFVENEQESSQLPRELKGEEEHVESYPGMKTGQSTENDEENVSKTFVEEEKETRENVQKEEMEKNLKRTEVSMREREREKDRIAVERAIREARERAFAEARERAERAAVEKATAGVRQRAMAGAREKLEKVSAGTKVATDKASIEAKLRAERAAVERATAEARERALEKALSQKSISETRTQAERNVSGKLSGASRDSGLKHSFSSSDLERFDGTNNESAQRRKARLERHQRIMERAAKALAEKNLRDVLAQREQAERNRLAETLDADIKRWASGKEGNLRALLSTLQYILGPGSGWQPISLTEIVTSNAIKKAYRKATLYVHPDKLQQRGASIQQKYICEKIFDLLKAAWNKFNSEER